jgi:hypothetical protein
MVSGSGASGGKGSFGMPVVYPARPPGTRIRPGHPTVPLIDRAFHLQSVGAWRRRWPSATSRTWTPPPDPSGVRTIVAVPSANGWPSSAP